MNANELKASLQLMPHPEGGFYRETYRSAFSLSNTEGGSRNLATTIYYLLEDEQKSHFHRLRSDEMWFFHMGETLEILLIRDGVLERLNLGPKVDKGDLLQVLMPANTWFAARILHSKGFSLVSCLVVPGFDFRDFELGKAEVLKKDFPFLGEIIEEFSLP
jgi:predicted cupin superfamily sugar epimerase